MKIVNLNQLELAEFTSAQENSQHCKCTFPLLGAQGTKQLATVYFELDPGEQVGSHRDSAEEILLILDGEAEVIVGNEKVRAGKNMLALVPEMVPHNVINRGHTTVKAFGIFGGVNNIVAHFENKWDQLPSYQVSTADMQEPAAV